MIYWADTVSFYIPHLIVTYISSLRASIKSCIMQRSHQIYIYCTLSMLYLMRQTQIWYQGIRHWNTGKDWQINATTHKCIKMCSIFFKRKRHKILLTNKIKLTSLRPLLSSFKTSPGRKPEIPSWSVSPLWLKPLENN